MFLTLCICSVIFDNLVIIIFYCIHVKNKNICKYLLIVILTLQWGILILVLSNANVTSLLCIKFLFIWIYKHFDNANVLEKIK